MSSEKKPQPVARFQDVFDPETTIGWKMESDPAGDWVRYSDHEATIEALRAERDEARKDIEAFWKPQFDEQVERAETAEARVVQLEAAQDILRQAENSICYPVDTSIKADGFDIRPDKDVRYAVALIRRVRALLSDGGR